MCNVQQGHQLGSTRCARPMETAWSRTAKMIPNVLIMNASMAASASHVKASDMVSKKVAVLAMLASVCP